MFSVNSIIKKFTLRTNVTEPAKTMYTFAPSALTPDNADKLVGLRVQIHSFRSGAHEGVVTNVDFHLTKWGVDCEVSVDVDISGSYIRSEPMPMIFSANDIKMYWE